MTKFASLRIARLRALPRIATQLFIAIHIAAIVTWDIPLSSPESWPLIPALRSYVRWAGLWQSWSMFAPDPISINIRTYARITDRDGRVVSLDLLPMRGRQDWLARYRRDRYRKWVIDHVRRDDHALLWPGTAQFMLRQARGTVANPVSVTLVRRWRQVTFPANVLEAPAEGPVRSYPFYTYQVPRP